MAHLKIRIDDNLEYKARKIAESMGLDLTGAVRLFLHQMVRDNGLPFRPTADPFYSESNIRHLKRALKDMNAGRNIQVHELIEE